MHSQTSDTTSVLNLEFVYLKQPAAQAGWSGTCSCPQCVDRQEGPEWDVGKGHRGQIVCYPSELRSVHALKTGFSCTFLHVVNRCNKC